MRLIITPEEVELDFREFYRATRNLLTYRGKLPNGMEIKRWKELSKSEQDTFVHFVAAGLGPHLSQMLSTFIKE